MSAREVSNATNQKATDRDKLSPRYANILASSDARQLPGISSSKMEGEQEKSGSLLLIPRKKNIFVSWLMLRRRERDERERERKRWLPGRWIHCYAVRRCSFLSVCVSSYMCTRVSSCGCWWTRASSRFALVWPTF